MLLFKGPNPLQSTLWNANTLSPPPLFSVWGFHLYFLLFLTFLDCGQRNKSLGLGMSCGNLQEENHLRNESFHTPHPPPGECLTVQAFKHNGDWTLVLQLILTLKLKVSKIESCSLTLTSHTQRPRSYSNPTNNMWVLCLECFSQKKEVKET